MLAPLSAIILSIVNSKVVLMSTVIFYAFRWMTYNEMVDIFREADVDRSDYLAKSEFWKVIERLLQKIVAHMGILVTLCSHDHACARVCCVLMTPFLEMCISSCVISKKTFVGSESLF